MPLSPEGRLRCRLHGSLHPVGIFPLVVGRAPECGIVVTDADVSRHHACIMRTPAGYAVVDTSAYGTFVNGEPVAAQRVLEAGDLIEIGGRTFEFELPDAPDLPHDPASPDDSAEVPTTRSYRQRRSTNKRGLLRGLPANRNRWLEWIRRYGLAELAGTAAAMGGYWLGIALIGSRIAGVFAATLGESLGFYGTLVLRDLVRDAYAAGAHRSRYGPREMAATCRNLFVEFGPAEVLDSLVVRPLCLGLGTHYLGARLGIVLGKLVADLVFYATPILTAELRRRRPPGGAIT